ncbi:MAG: DUF1840 domain-containing protein [Hahellaceae bacterium]|nr:DUF1840 domain-containing protein [Hahellaceae bacterium]
MLVTFKTPDYARLTFFGSVAVSLIKLMGHSGHVPGSIGAEEVADAPARLRDGLARIDAQAAEGKPRKIDDSEQEADVGLSLRAKPLIELLEAARAWVIMSWE